VSLCIFRSHADCADCEEEAAAHSHGGAAAHAALRTASGAAHSKRCDGREYLDATKIARGFLCKRLRRLDFTTIQIESPQHVHTARSGPDMHANERAQTPKSKDARAAIARLSQRKLLRRADATQR
jgi:hypothetical protein